MSLGKRVQKAREHAGINQPQLAERVRRLFPGCQITQQTISKIERGAESTEYAVKIATACGVSPLWVDAGVGPMVVAKDAQVVLAQPGRPDPDLLQGVIEVVEQKLPTGKFRLSPRDRAHLIAQAYAFLKPDGDIDMSKVLDVVVNPLKLKQERQGGRERERKRKGGAR